MTILFPYMARWSSAHASRYYHLLSHVADLGHTIYVLQPPSRGSSEANDIDVVLKANRNIIVHTVTMNATFWRAEFPFEKFVKKLYYSIKSWKYVRDIIKEKDIDVLYLYNIPQIFYLLGKRPIVVFDLADDLLGMLQAEMCISPGHPLNRIAQWSLKWMIKKSDVCTCISAPLYESIDHARKYIISNGAEVFDGIQDLVPAEHRAEDGIVVGYVGAFEYSMGLDSIIEVSQRMPRVQFLLVGSGRDFARIQEQVRQRQLRNVVLTGAVSHDQAIKYMASTHICLNLFNKSRISDAVSSLKLFEYLSLRRPVISTRLMEAERVGASFLFFADTVDEIVQAIRYISSHPEEVRQKVEAGFKVFQEKYVWRKLAQDFVAAIQSVPAAIPAESR